MTKVIAFGPTTIEVPDGSILVGEVGKDRRIAKAQNGVVSESNPLGVRHLRRKGDDRRDPGHPYDYSSSRDPRIRALDRRSGAVAAWRKSLAARDSSILSAVKDAQVAGVATGAASLSPGELADALLNGATVRLAFDLGLRDD